LVSVLYCAKQHAVASQVAMQSLRLLATVSVSRPCSAAAAAELLLK
jgi:hypothetical protein